MNREVIFKKIKDSVGETYYSDESQIIINDDCINSLKKIPSNSISLILTDPPYHATKKKNIYGDTLFKQDDQYIKWMEEISTEWRRILKPNGSLYCFCDSSMSARLEVMLSSKFNILSHIVWTKPNKPGFDGWKGKMNKDILRQWYGHSERIIFAEPAKNGNLHRSSFGEFLKNKRKEAGLSGNKLTELTGAFGKVNHGGAVSNWETGRNIPSREQYEKIKNAILSSGKVDEMPDYEDVIRPFNINKDIEYTDVWNFESVRPYSGKHPAEKPQDMLEHIILASSYENDIVLDCFAGSGSTAMASLKNKRKCISIEIDIHWVEYILNRTNLLV
ncbi:MULTISPECIES: DNA methyltransferase [unclassified Enterobacter cloacae complex]|uniref:DNA methyltransferase n=1 Tax=unclassified Enterobacter cloacae complex TaxID=2757714 RepID=UPI0018726E43|nr:MULTISPECIES: DNA methyltransferase [unclassified Enterobacter cloacae complex]MBE4811047.1 site-specific DNA-methyltransferase [Enterobacter cloacae complex sp. P44RS]MBE4828313.1 site-specific DNA-methyltransferase [Enterobacter cloacae complex sp. P42RS]MBE4836756.1 site-specific DNA-methyltransferase [Enterobacter cloacae complex sp. P46RS]MBE4840651.1 site-specific DNA-methyltransferase [Enterobacter cloacae complex sp. P42C]